MIQVIIVDDEVFTVEGIVAAVDWQRLGISRVFTANSVKQAKEIILSNSVDLMLCDIEMPQESGIDLIEWTEKHFPEIEAIILSCHVDFKYAKRALQLGSFDYVVKPVPIPELEVVIASAIDKITEERKNLEVSRYGEYWYNNQQNLFENFIMDIINQTISSDIESISKAAEERNIPFKESNKVLPILTVVQKWGNSLDFKEEKKAILELKAITKKYLYNDIINSPILEIGKNRLLVILPVDEYEEVDLSKLKEGCKAFADFCKDKKLCEPAFYIGNPATLSEMPEILDKLYILEKSNVASKEIMMTLEGIRKPQGGCADTVQKVRDYVKLHINEDISRDEIAAYVYLNPDYLTRIFKKETGLLLMDYIFEERLKIAKELLSKTDIAIGDIAFKVGYSNFSHFAKMFKKSVGMNPVEYRNCEKCTKI